MLDLDMTIYLCYMLVKEVGLERVDRIWLSQDRV
jgi:hypothetical protein